jgi:hypothetical protein
MIGMIQVRQETRLAPVLDWLHPYYSGDVEGDERRGTALQRPAFCSTPVDGMFKKSVLTPRT